MPPPSKLFTGFRALGFVSNEIPLSVWYHQKHKENYVVTCVGKAFHVYNCSNLGIVNISNVHDGDIQCMAADATLVFTSTGKDIQAYYRGTEVRHAYRGHEYDVKLLMPFADHLISVDTCNCLKVWNINTQEIHTEIIFPDSFDVTCIIHPNTYLNKIVVASKQGSLQLYNINTNTLLYTFQRKDWNQPITALQQAPAVDVLAIGFADGRIVLHHLKHDKTLMEFKQDWGEVTALSFRTDGPPILLSGSPLGHIALWNLEEKKLASQIRDAHSDTVSGMQCLNNQPLMLTSSPDNSLKVWIFDMPDGGGRLLRQRSGHSAPPLKVKYHGDSGENILTAGQDSTLRNFSTIHDRLNKSLGRASYNKAETKRSGLKADKHMMPFVTDFASSTSRQSDWDSILACHKDEILVTTWNFVRSSMGSHKLRHPRFDNSAVHGRTAATCVEVSACGNFGLVGYSSGHVDIYNMQSGLHRGQLNKKKTAHDSSIRGLCLDQVNQVCVTAGGDCKLNFWRFKTHTLLASLTMPAQISKIKLHRESGMLGVVLDSFTVLVVDMDSRKVVRHLIGHTNTITDLTFSNDGRWLITASMDSTVRTWDLPCARLLDCFVVDAAVTSLAMSPSGHFLVTTHVSDLGVYLWANLSVFGHVSLKPLPADYEPQLLEMPATHASCTANAQGGNEESMDTDDQVDEEEEEFQSPPQLCENLVTMSSLPASRWQNLLNLDTIKKRNKPKEPPKKPAAAPFFLPTIAGLGELKFAPLPEEEKKEEKSKLVLGSLSPFGSALLNAETPEQNVAALERLHDMGPAAIEVELRCLGPMGGGSMELLAAFLTASTHALATNTHCDLTQAHLALFIKIHLESLLDGGSGGEELRQQLRGLQHSQRDAWLRTHTLKRQTLCVANYNNSAPL